MYTSLLLFALMGPDEAPRQASESPAWQDTYTGAVKAGRELSKPLAVFIGAGKDGWGKLSRESQLSAEAQKVLAASYVCVYLDTQTASGRRLADVFGIKDGLGLVLSTRDGQEQAFRHEGRMSRDELDGTLRRFANGAVSDRTETLARARVSYSYTPADNPAPRQQATPVNPWGSPAVYPASFGGFGGFGGGRGGC